MKGVDRAVYSEVIIDTQGEVLKQKDVYRVKEPDYVKLYLDCILLFKGLPKGLNPILIEFLSYMSYAGYNEYEGGQIIFVNKAMKDMIAKKLNVSTKRIEQAITSFVKTNIFKRVAVGTYQVNPNMFGKGDWVAIKNIRANFDFANNEIIADIIKEEEEKANATENSTD